VTVAFVTTTPEVLGHEDVDRPMHEAAFARADLALDHRVWWDPDVRWDRYDLVVVRSPWDYVERVGEYRRWLRSMDPLGTLRNPAAVVEWNLDKRYLTELGSAGVAVIPTGIAATDPELVQLLDAAVSGLTGQVVVKPVVSAGSRLTGRFDRGDPRGLALGRRILGQGLAVMVQPAVCSVATEGEVGVVLVDGEVSHAFRKGPVLDIGGGRLGPGDHEQVAEENLTVEQGRVVSQTIDWVHRMAGERLGVAVPLLYARVDLVRMDDGAHAVLEVELNEPSFNLSVDEGAADRFAAAVRRQVGE